MTARAGDALSHVSFFSLQANFPTGIQAGFKASARSESAVTILPPAPAPGGRRVSTKPNGSFRICMGAMTSPGCVESDSPKFTCRDDVNTDEHFVYQ